MVKDVNNQWLFEGDLEVVESSFGVVAFGALLKGLASLPGRIHLPAPREHRLLKREAFAFVK